MAGVLDLGRRGFGGRGLRPLFWISLGMISIKPDRIIKSEDYMLRWHLIPRNRYFNIFLHKVVGSDPQDLHDHPWASLSFLLNGGWLYEVTPDTGEQPSNSGKPTQKVSQRIKRFRPKCRSANYTHRLIIPHGPCWTLFITGPVLQPWGFWTEKGWVHHKNYDG